MKSEHVQIFTDLDVLLHSLAFFLNPAIILILLLLEPLIPPSFLFYIPLY